MGEININQLKDVDAAEQNFLTILQQEPNNVQVSLSILEEKPHNVQVTFVTELPRSPQSLRFLDPQLW